MGARYPGLHVFAGKNRSQFLPWPILADRGVIDLNKRLAEYWPEFGQAGKDKITVEQLLSHLAAIPGAFSARKGDAYDSVKMAQAIEVPEPLWEPGTQGCYHTFTMGYLCSELVRRVTDRTLGQFVREQISLPLDLDFRSLLRCQGC